MMTSFSKYATQYQAQRLEFDQVMQKRVHVDQVADWRLDLRASAILVFFGRVADLLISIIRSGPSHSTVSVIYFSQWLDLATERQGNSDTFTESQLMSLQAFVSKHK